MKREDILKILEQSDKLLGNFTDKQLQTHALQRELAKEAPKYTCEYCGKKNIDYMNYVSSHSNNCKWSHITKEMILEAHSKFDCAVDCWEYLEISRKVYIRFCEQFELEPKFADLESIKKVSSEHNSKGLNVWKYDSTTSDGKGEFIGWFKSMTIAAIALNTNRVYIDDCIKKRYPTAKPKYIFEKTGSNRCFGDLR